MKISKKNLKKLIKEALDDRNINMLRSMRRKKAGLDDKEISSLQAIDTSGDYTLSDFHDEVLNVRDSEDYSLTNLGSTLKDADEAEIKNRENLAKQIFPQIKQHGKRAEYFYYDGDGFKDEKGYRTILEIVISLHPGPYRDWIVHVKSYSESDPNDWLSRETIYHEDQVIFDTFEEAIEHALNFYEEYGY